MIKEMAYIKIEEAKGKEISAKLLNKIPDRRKACYIVLQNNKQDGTLVYFITDKAKNPIYVLKKQTTNHPDRINRIREEYAYGKKLGDEHPNFIKTFCLEEEKEANDPIIFEMLMEYGGESLDVYKYRSLSIERKRSIGAQTICAMAYMHRKEPDPDKKSRIMHSDLKLQNIVYKDVIAKIIDFGCALDLKEGETSNYIEPGYKELKGFTISYVPPEFHDYNINHKLPDKFNKIKFDVYCWGLLMFFLLNDKSLPAREMDEFRLNKEKHDKLLEQIRSLKTKYKDSYSGVLIDLICQCLEYDPMDRPTFEILEKAIHKFCPGFKASENPKKEAVHLEQIVVLKPVRNDRNIEERRNWITDDNSTTGELRQTNELNIQNHAHQPQRKYATLILCSIILYSIVYCTYAAYEEFNSNAQQTPEPRKETVKPGLSNPNVIYLTNPYINKKLDFPIPEIYLAKSYVAPIEIGELQDILVYLGYMKKEDLEDGCRGLFGPLTFAAVTRYQEDSIIRGRMTVVDVSDGAKGVYGKRTMRALKMDLGYIRIHEYEKLKK